MARKVKKVIPIIILAIAILLPYAGAFYLKRWYDNKLKEVDGAAFIVISKEDMALRLFDYKGHLREEYPIACGQGLGDKQKVGDMRTPEGVFHISSIEDASSWEHDFGDGKGKISGAYGPYFFRLEVPGHKGIGIHGTHDPNSIGTRATEGCIRLNNDDLRSLKESVYVGMVVVITGSAQDLLALAMEKEKEMKKEKEKQRQINVQQKKQGADSAKQQTDTAIHPKSEEQEKNKETNLDK